jgi:hypothetical protein
MIIIFVKTMIFDNTTTDLKSIMYDILISYILKNRV